MGNRERRCGLNALVRDGCDTAAANAGRDVIRLNPSPMANVSALCRSHRFWVKYCRQPGLTYHFLFLESMYLVRSFKRRDALDQQPIMVEWSTAFPTGCQEAQLIVLVPIGGTSMHSTGLRVLSVRCRPTCIMQVIAKSC